MVAKLEKAILPSSIYDFVNNEGINADFLYGIQPY